jgi:hypothetical protein
MFTMKIIWSLERGKNFLSNPSFTHGVNWMRRALDMENLPVGGDPVHIGANFNVVEGDVKSMDEILGIDKYSKIQFYALEDGEQEEEIDDPIPKQKKKKKRKSKRKRKRKRENLEGEDNSDSDSDSDSDSNSNANRRRKSRRTKNISESSTNL